MELTPESVAAERDRVADRADAVVPILNETRAHLGELFDADVDGVATVQYRREVDAVFADGDRAVNVAAYVGLLRELDVAGDYPGFVVDEVLGRRLAAAVAGGTPLSVLAEATFHVADVRVRGDDGEGAGVNDLDAALAAGLQTRLPGWEWTAGDSPFAVPPRE
ncbi:MAG: hypothetical protein ABEJ79_05755 [Halolamina sp.]